MITTEKILKSILMDWKNLARIQKELKITESLDVRFLKLKLKEFERKNLIECKEISEETHYKCPNDLLYKKEIKRINSSLSKEQPVQLKKTSASRIVKLEEPVMIKGDFGQQHSTTTKLIVSNEGNFKKYLQYKNTRKINWKPEIKNLTQISKEIYKNKEITKEQFFQRLSVIFPEFKFIENVDNRAIGFLEFCFYMADGPYSKKFLFFVIVLRRVFKIYPPLRLLINKTGAAAIANMALGGIGGLKFNISDYYELRQVLWAWRKMGLKRETVNSIYRAIKKKWRVKKDIDDQKIFLLVRLKAIFPMYQKSFIRSNLDLNSAIYEHFKARFKKIIVDYQKKGFTIEEMIKKENDRKMPSGIHRNNLLSYLVKKRRKFECQICPSLNHVDLDSYQIEAHHIVPLSEGGEDNSHNMIVVCEKHHQETHEGHVVIELDENVIVKYKKKRFLIDYN